PDNEPGNIPRASWRSHGHLLFANWLNYYVYQLTSYRVEDIGKVFTYGQGGK
ncbi:MAG: homoserine O-acetyltransferase/O-succinyltransferase family protein, partial [Aeromonas sobria]